MILTHAERRGPAVSPQGHEMNSTVRCETRRRGGAWGARGGRLPTRGAEKSTGRRPHSLVNSRGTGGHRERKDGWARGPTNTTLPLGGAAVPPSGAREEERTEGLGVLTVVSESVDHPAWRARRAASALVSGPAAGGGREEEAGKNYPFRLRWRLRLRGGAGGVDNRSMRCETCEWKIETASRHPAGS